MTAKQINRQDNGWVKFAANALTLANAAISKARNATPEAERELYRGYIRRLGEGYEWGWVLK